MSARRTPSPQRSPASVAPGASRCDGARSPAGGATEATTRSTMATMRWAASTRRPTRAGGADGVGRGDARVHGVPGDGDAVAVAERVRCGLATRRLDWSGAWEGTRTPDLRITRSIRVVPWGAGQCRHVPVFPGQ